MLQAGTGTLAQEVPESSKLVIAVAGDTIPEPPWYKSQRIESIMDAMREEFARADLVFLNLEQPITSSKTVTPHKDPAHVKAKRDYILRAKHPGIARMLKDAGVGLVGLANNHMMDYMATGLLDTMQYFRDAELPVVGAGLKSEAERPLVFEKYGRRVALLAFSDVVPIGAKATATAPGIASSKNDTDLTEAITRARSEADFVVLMIHWGGQGNHLITPRQRQLGRKAVEAGCNAVVGMHPHVLQGVEYIGVAPVFYSLGNFAVAASAPSHKETVVARLIFGETHLESVEVVPVFASRDGSPQVAEGRRAKEILAGLDRLCRTFNSRVTDGKLAAGPVREKLVYDLSRRSAPRSKPKAKASRVTPGGKGRLR